MPAWPIKAAPAGSPAPAALSARIAPGSPATADSSTMPPQNPPLGRNFSSARNTPTASTTPASTLASGRSNTSPPNETGSPGHRSSIAHTSEPNISAPPVSASIITPGNRNTSTATSAIPNRKNSNGS